MFAMDFKKNKKMQFIVGVGIRTKHDDQTFEIFPVAKISGGQNLSANTLCLQA